MSSRLRECLPCAQLSVAPPEPAPAIATVHDPFYTPTLFRETAAGIPNGRLMLYEKMRHPATGKQFERDVLAFLGETQ